MEASPLWIDRQPVFVRQLESLGSGPIALDTEADSFHHYPEKVCLIQLSVEGRDWLIDPLAPVDLRVLGPPLADPRLRKVLHGADYDVRVLHRDFALVMRGLFDTMIAARLVGERTFGLAAVLETYLGVKLDKRYQLADWSQRPLPPEMARYATADTRYLTELAERLEQRLEQLGRVAWAEEEFARLEGVRWGDGAEPEAFRKIRGAASLDGRGLVVLRALVEWREAEARRRARPPFRVLGNELLLRLSRRAPTNLRGLKEVSGFPGRGVSREQAEALLGAVTRALSLPRDSWPEPASGKGRRRASASQRRLRKLARRRDRLARELGLEPSLVAPKELLERLLGCVESGTDPETLEGLRRWQCDLLRPELKGL